MCDNSEVEGVEQTMSGRGKNDRPGDPLWPLMPVVLEALRAKNSEKFGQESSGGVTVDEYSAVLESICGATDDSQPVEQYNGTLGVTRNFVDTHQSSVGQIQWNSNLAAIFTNPGTVNGARWCTGTMISDDLFLTAGHCFDQTGGNWQRPRVNGTSNIISSAEIATNMHVNFNFQVDPAGNMRTEVTFPIIGLIEYRLGGLDFAIVRLGGNPGATWGRATVATGDAVAGDMLCIIGHPAGMPKRIEAGAALAPSGNQIRYDSIDTLGGNSGSAVLRASDGRIVGVHTNGGCGPSSPNGTDANTGQRIVAVIGASPTLQALTRPPVVTANAADVLATLRAADRIGSVATRLSADIAATLRANDVLGTLRSLDQLATSIARDTPTKFKARDDVKLPQLDKRPASDSKRPGSDGFGPFDPSGPLVNPAIGRARPFVLATPHHALGGGEAVEGGELEGVEMQLAEMQAAMQQQNALLEALEADYEELAAAYEAMLSGQG